MTPVQPARNHLDYGWRVAGFGQSLYRATGHRHSAHGAGHDGVRLARPRFEDVGSEFRVTLIGPGDRFMAEVGKRPAWAGNLNERQVEAVLYASEHGQITNRAYREITGVSRRWATKELQDIVDCGILVERGTKRTTHYVLVRDQCAIVRDNEKVFRHELHEFTQKCDDQQDDET